jgi:hypothetical protein
MKKSATVVGLVAMLSLVVVGSVYATPMYYSQFTMAYPTSGTSSFGCAICHNPALGSPGLSTLYNYGLAFKNAGFNFKTIEPLDSDSDGTTNIAEITAGTNPSDPTSTPATSSATPSRIGVFSNGSWYVDKSGNGMWDNMTMDGMMTFGAGLQGAKPVAGDWNGTGTTKIGVYVNGVWYLDMNGNGIWDGTPTDATYTFGAGLTGAMPVTGDWGGTGKTKIGVYDPATGTWYLDMNGNGIWDGTPTDATYTFGAGLTGAVPVTGDWSGTGKTGIGVYANGVWYLDMNGNGIWDGTPTDATYTFGAGLNGAIPVTGDWSGTGKAGIGVYANGVWYLDMNGNGIWNGAPTDTTYTFGAGLQGAMPISGKW